MNDILYKVAPAARYYQGQCLNTLSVNYGLVCHRSIENFQCVYNAIINASRDSELGFHSLTLTAMAFQSAHEGALKLAELFREYPAEHLIDLQDYLPVVFTHGKKIHLGPLSHLAVAAHECATLIREENGFANGLWEHLYELVRQQVAPDAPSRLEVLFACLDRETTERFASDFTSYGDTIWMLDASACHSRFEADMSWLNRIESTASAEQAGRQVTAYWRQQRTDHPMVEVLLQGDITLLETEPV